MCPCVLPAMIQVVLRAGDNCFSLGETSDRLGWLYKVASGAQWIQHRNQLKNKVEGTMRFDCWRRILLRSVTKLVRNALENCQVQGCVGSLIRWSVSWRGLHQAEDCRVLGKVQDMEKGGRTGAWLTEARALSAPHCEKQRQGWTHSWGDPMAIFAYKLQFLLREKGE